MRHLAFIMDGNRRWAQKNGLKSIYKRKEVLETVRTVIRFCLEQSIDYLTLYMLSLENVEKRSHQFLRVLFSLITTIYEQEIDFLIEQGVRINFIGDRKLYPVDVLCMVQALEEATKDCTRLTLSLLFYYGARQEIFSAVKSLAYKVQEGKCDATNLTQSDFKQELWTANLPDPELIIRTGSRGATRMSNFLLFQAAYSELQFLDIYWPELTYHRLYECMNHYTEANRNFGR